MKLTYDQMRQLSSIGGPQGKLVIKNKKGHVMKCGLKKWGKTKETKYMSTEVGQKPSHVPMANLSQTSLHPFSLRHPQLLAKR